MTSLTMGIQSSAGVPLYASKAAVTVLAILSFISAREILCFDRGVAFGFAAILGIALTGIIVNIAQSDEIMFPLLFIEDVVTVSFLMFAGAVIFDVVNRRPAVALLWALLAAQAVALGVKVTTYGVDESNWIGTLHHSAGQLSTVVPVALAAAAVTMGMIWRPAYLLVTIIAIAMAVIGEKRAGVYLIPTALIGSCLVNAYVFSRHGAPQTWWCRAKFRSKSVFVVILLALSVASPVAFVKLIPSFQPAEAQAFMSPPPPASEEEDVDEGRGIVVAVPKKDADVAVRRAEDVATFPAGTAIEPRNPPDAIDSVVVMLPKQLAAFQAHSTSSKASPSPEKNIPENMHEEKNGTIEKVRQSLDRVIGYTLAYMTKGYDDRLNTSEFSVEENTNIQLGRGLMIVEMVRTFSSLPPLEITFGLGGSKITPSPHLGPDRHDIMFNLFGLRGAIPFAFKVLFEAGLVGFGLLIVFFSGVTILILRRMILAETKVHFSVAAVAFHLHVAVAFDTFLYSDVAWTSLTVAPLYFTLLGASLMRQPIDRSAKANACQE